MSLYKKILVAVDLSDESQIITGKAMELAKHSDAELSLVHVIEPIAVGYAIEVSSVDIEGLHEEASRQAHDALMDMGAGLGIPEDRVYPKLGNPAKEIRALAESIDADLIVTGSHGRHGWELLFGSTSNEVSRGVKCDLLAVRIPD